MSDDVSILRGWADAVQPENSKNPKYQKRRRRRSGIGTFIGIIVFIGLVVGAGVIGDGMVRDLTSGVIRSQFTSAFGLEKNHPMDIEIAGKPLLLQAVGGRLDAVTVAIDDVPLSELSTSLVLTANGIPLSLTGETHSVAIDVRIAAADLMQLAPYVGTVALTDVTIADGAVRASSTLASPAGPVPVTVDYQVAAVTGQVVFTPVVATLNGAPVTIEQIAALGVDSAAAVAPHTLCVATSIPKALELVSAGVDASGLALRFTGSDLVLASSAFLAKGTCG